ncbi:hypothetical protein GJQ54_05120 [Oceanospirillaceae bacterium ASx5O]|nr:hypothetical protein GJQ54_05120 [Oceanospirillaceae bacterium ASx5O]
MNIEAISNAHGVTIEAARAIIAAAVEHAESQLNLEYNSPAGRMESEEAERALWLVRDFAAGTEMSDEEKAEAALWLEDDDERKDWRDE